jgi:hypothetical protein
LGDQIKPGGMDGACNTYGREEKYMQEFGTETRRKQATWKTHDVEWIHLAQGSKHWQALVKATVNI